MLTPNQLREVLKRHDFKPLKRFGENYLVDANIKDKIIAAVGASGGMTVLEIGPGMGALTVDLARSGASVTAVEKDRKAFAILSELVAGRFPNLALACGDFLEYDIGEIARDGKIRVVGNLPYYITSPIIERLIENARSIDRAVILVQKEVAERLLAMPGSKAYGSLSVFAQYHAELSYVHTVKRSSFYPQPEVDSAIVRLDMRGEPPCPVRDEALFFRIVRGAFNQRRKSVINSLSREAVLDLPKAGLAALLERSGVDPAARPETLGIPDFARIANQF